MCTLHVEFGHARVRPPFSVTRATAKSSISSMATKKPTMEPALGDLTNRGNKKKELTNNERIQVVAMLIGLSMAGPLPKGVFDDLAKKNLVKPRTVRRVWKLAVKSKATGTVDTDEAASNDVVRGFNGRKCRAEDTMEAVKNMPHRKRTTWEALAEQLGMPESTTREHKKQGVFRHTSPSKPFLPIVLAVTKSR